MTAQQNSQPEDRKKERRRLIILAVLLFLVIGCLVCGTAQLATMGIDVDTGQSVVLSRLNADYSPWETLRFAPVDPAIIAEAMQDRGWIPLPAAVAEVPPEESPAGPSGDETPSPEGEATATTTGTPRPSATPVPTATLQPTPTYTPVPTDTTEPPPPPPPDDTPTPTPTATPDTAVIAGMLLNDLDYAGGNGTAAGVCDATMQYVMVALYQGSTPSDPPDQTTTTDDNCAYTFAPSANGPHMVRVLATTFPSLPILPEQTYAYGASALGGQDPDVPNDHWVVVDLNGVDILNVDFSFSYEAVVNENDSGQGSLEQAIRNANAIAGANTIVFASPLHSSYTITPDTGGFSAISGINGAFTTIDGTMTAVTLDGSGLGAIDGLSIQAANVTIQGLTIRDFGDNGIYVGGAADNAAIQDCTISLNYTSGIWVDAADGVNISGCTLENNVGLPQASRGQIEIRGTSAGGTIEGCVVANDLAINSRGADGIRFDWTDASGWLVQDNEIYGHANSSSNEGIIVRGDNHRIIANTSYSNWTGITVAEFLSDGNLISQNSIYGNTGLGIDLSGCPVAGGPNECIVSPTLSTPGPGRIVQATFPPGGGPNQTVEFFLSEHLDAAGGEGETFCFAVSDGDSNDGAPAMGTIQVDLDDPDIIVGPCGTISIDTWLTATFIDNSNNTSEFAVDIQAP